MLLKRLKKIHVLLFSLSKRVRQWQHRELFFLGQVEPSAKLLVLLFVFVEKLRFLEIHVLFLAPSWWFWKHMYLVCEMS